MTFHKFTPHLGPYFSTWSQVLQKKNVLSPYQNPCSDSSLMKKYIQVPKLGQTN